MLSIQYMREILSKHQQSTSTVLVFSICGCMVPDSFQTETSEDIVGFEPGISGTEVGVLNTELRRL